MNRQTHKRSPGFLSKCFREGLQNELNALFSLGNVTTSGRRVDNAMRGVLHQRRHVTARETKDWEQEALNKWTEEVETGGGLVIDIKVGKCRNSACRNNCVMNKHN